MQTRAFKLRDIKSGYYLNFSDNFVRHAKRRASKCFRQVFRAKIFVIILSTRKKVKLSQTLNRLLHGQSVLEFKDISYYTSKRVCYKM